MTRTAGWRAAAARALALLAVAAALAGPPWLFVRWREGRLAELARPEAQADWDSFRDRMRRESGRDGPVQRKVPRSDEPPERVWLRDYWRLAIAAWVVFVAALTAFLAMLVRGGAASATENGTGRRRHHEEQHERDAEHADEGEHARDPAEESPAGPIRPA